MSSETITTFTDADARFVVSLRRKFPRAADTMLRLAVVTMARDALYDSTARVLAERLAVLEKENAELRQQLATIQEKCGADFEKVRFITGVQLITHDEPIECDRCKNDLPGDCKLPGDDCQFEEVENA